MATTSRKTSSKSSSSGHTTKKRSTSTRRKTSASHKKASSSSSHKSSGSGQACWPGYKRVAGTKAGSKGSCEPKAHQTKGEKKADSKAAAARKREKTGHD